MLRTRWQNSRFSSQQNDVMVTSPMWFLPRRASCSCEMPDESSFGHVSFVVNARLFVLFDNFRCAFSNSPVFLSRKNKSVLDKSCQQYIYPTPSGRFVGWARRASTFGVASILQSSGTCNLCNVRKSVGRFEPIFEDVYIWFHESGFSEWRQLLFLSAGK